MSRVAYVSPGPDEWVPLYREYRTCCCDCGLVHRFFIRVKAGKVQMRVERDNRATAQIRFHRKDAA